MGRRLTSIVESKTRTMYCTVLSTYSKRRSNYLM